MNVFVSRPTVVNTGCQGTAGGWVQIVPWAHLCPTAAEGGLQTSTLQITLLPSTEDEDAAFERACRERLARQLRQEA